MTSSLTGVAGVTAMDVVPNICSRCWAMFVLMVNGSILLDQDMFKFFWLQQLERIGKMGFENGVCRSTYIKKQMVAQHRKSEQ